MKATRVGDRCRRPINDWTMDTYVEHDWLEHDMRTHAYCWKITCCAAALLALGSFVPSQPAHAQFGIGGINLGGIRLNLNGLGGGGSRHSGSSHNKGGDDSSSGNSSSNSSSNSNSNSNNS